MAIDRRFVTVLAISLGWAAIVTGVFYRVAGSGGPSARAESQKQIVVAAATLPVGSTIDGKSIRLRLVPESFAPAGAYSRKEDVLDRPVINPIQAGEPVIEARLAPKGSGVGLAPMIPPGMRAIAVRVNDVVGVAGFVLPGMRVDVLVTGRPPNQGDTITRTVLQNIAVLSAGQTIQTDGKSPSISAPVVTLLVNPSDAEALTLANNEGHIQLVLRNSTDGQTPSTPGRRMREIFAAGTEPADAPRLSGRIARTRARRAPEEQRAALASQSHPEPARVEQQMVVIHGNEKKIVIFRGGDTQ